jgi:hypothetical protein
MLCRCSYRKEEISPLTTCSVPTIATTTPALTYLGGTKAQTECKAHSDEEPSLIILFCIIFITIIATSVIQFIASVCVLKYMLENYIHNKKPKNKNIAVESNEMIENDLYGTL